MLLQPEGAGGFQKGSNTPCCALGSTRAEGFGKPRSKHLSPCKADTTLADTRGDFQGRGAELQFGHSTHLGCRFGKSREHLTLLPWVPLWDGAGTAHGAALASAELLVWGTSHPGGAHTCTYICTRAHTHVHAHAHVHMEQ